MCKRTYLFTSNLSLPTGGCANGIPRNFINSFPPRDTDWTPWILPLCVSTNKGFPLRCGEVGPHILSRRHSCSFLRHSVVETIVPKMDKVIKKRRSIWTEMLLETGGWIRGEWSNEKLFVRIFIFAESNR